MLPPGNFKAIRANALGIVYTMTSPIGCSKNHKENVSNHRVQVVPSLCAGEVAEKLIDVETDVSVHGKPDQTTSFAQSSSRQSLEPQTKPQTLQLGESSGAIRLGHNGAAIEVKW